MGCRCVVFESGEMGFDAFRIVGSDIGRPRYR
jgi:hypothetical protein